MTKNNQNSSMETVWAVRDARGLNANEKVFLFVVASRGVMKTSRDTTLEDCGFSKATLYRVIESLTTKGLINVSQGKYNPVSNKRDQTYYTINLPALKDSLSETDDSHTETQESHTETEDSQRADNKVTVKVTEKVTTKVTTTPPAAVDAKSVEEEEVQVFELPSSPLVDDPSLGLEVPSHPLAVNTYAGDNKRLLDLHKKKKDDLAERMQKSAAEQAERKAAFAARRKTA